MFSHLHNVEMTRRYRKDHDLMGFEADDLLGIFDNLREEEIWQYRYPSWDKLDDVGVRGIYLEIICGGILSPTPTNGRTLQLSICGTESNL